MAPERGEAALQQMHLAVLLNKHTTKACLRRFVEEGGIPVLHTWLSEAKKNFPKRRKHLLQLLDTFAVLPISLDTLKKSQLGKTVKALSKLNDTEISEKSQKLMSSWLNLLTPDSQPTSQPQAADSRKRSLYDLFSSLLSSPFLFFFFLLVFFFFFSSSFSLLFLLLSSCEILEANISIGRIRSLQ